LSFVPQEKPQGRSPRAAPAKKCWRLIQTVSQVSVYLDTVTYFELYDSRILSGKSLIFGNYSDPNNERASGGEVSHLES